MGSCKVCDGYSIPVVEIKRVSCPFHSQQMLHFWAALNLVGPLLEAAGRIISKAMLYVCAATTKSLLGHAL
jgi:hypothetical protein